jgi:hypothetical protein
MYWSYFYSSIVVLTPNCNFWVVPLLHWVSSVFLIDLLGNRRGIYGTCRNSILSFHFNFHFKNKNLCVDLFIVLKYSKVLIIRASRSAFHFNFHFKSKNLCADFFIVLKYSKVLIIRASRSAFHFNFHFKNKNLCVDLFILLKYSKVLIIRASVCIISHKNGTTTLLFSSHIVFDGI